MAGALVQDYTMLLVVRSFVGIGEAAYASLGPAVLSDCIPESQRARRFTWFYLAIPVGSALGYALGGVVAQHYGWRAAFLVAGVPGLILAAFLLRLADPERGALDATKETESLRQARRASGRRVSYPGVAGLHRELRRLHVRDGRAGDVGAQLAAAPLPRGDRRRGHGVRRHRRGHRHPRHVHRGLRDRSRPASVPESGRGPQRGDVLLAAPFVFWGLHAQKPHGGLHAVLRGDAPAVHQHEPGERAHRELAARLGAGNGHRRQRAPDPSLRRCDQPGAGRPAQHRRPGAWHVAGRCPHPWSRGGGAGSHPLRLWCCSSPGAVRRAPRGPRRVRSRSIRPAGPRQPDRGYHSYL